MNKKTWTKLIITLVVCALLSFSLVQSVKTPMPTVRVIVEGEHLSTVKDAVKLCDGFVSAEIEIINAVVAEIPETNLSQLQASPGIVRITPDRQLRLTDLANSSGKGRDGNAVDVEFTKSLGVQDVWEAGTLGQDVTVAVLDTGVDPRFISLRRNPLGRGDRFLAYYDAINDHLYEHPGLLRSPRDKNGHGTHVAGIIANRDFEAQDREFRGVAPAADLVAIRVLNEDGAGSYADVLRGINWAVEHKDDYNIRVLNISMYAVPVAPYWADPYNLAVMAAWDAGIVVVASAGNTGPDPMSIGVPGNTPYVITIGAFTDHRTPEAFGDDYIPDFSAVGPTLDAFVKPDVIAPGAHVISLMHPSSQLRRTNPDQRISGRYFEMSGSSMATASVSGLAALILSENPELTPDEVKFRLMQTARPQYSEAHGEAAYSIWQQGAGRAWAPDAVMGEISGAANHGMDIDGDLAGSIHYQGWSIYNEEAGAFQIIGSGSDQWVEGYTAWSGSYDSWADGYDSWAGGLTNWSGSYDSWADGLEIWSGSFDSWADSYDSWADSFDSWADSFDSWADGCLADSELSQSYEDSFDSWADSFDSWADSFDSWADYTASADSFDSWADSFDSWADSFDSWADSYDSWADGCQNWPNSFDSWADGLIGWTDGVGGVAEGLAMWTGAFGVWEGGYTTWSTSFDSWADSFDSWADGYGYWASACGVDPSSFDSWADSFDSWADSYDSWADSFDSWADSYDSWADYVIWVDSFDSWADSFDSWADSFDSWADGYDGDGRPVLCVEWSDSFDSWADSFDSWADSFDSWADGSPNVVGAFDEWDGGYTAWVGGYASWAGSFDSWADNVGDPAWASNYAQLKILPNELSSVNMNFWVELPK